MKHLIKRFSSAAAILVAGALALPAQQRFGGGGGGGGFGGFGGFGGNRGFGGAGNTTATYNNNGTVGSAIITVDPDTHNIVVTADAVTAAQIRDVLAKLDAPKPQVLIKVVFMEVDHNNDLDVGVEGGWAGQGNGLSQSAGNVFGLSGLNNVVTNFNVLGQTTPFQSLTPGSAATLLPSSGSIYQIAGSDFQATLRAVASAGKAQVLSRPSILARDGQLAQIVVGQSVYLPTGVTFTSSGSGTAAFPVINGSYQNVGIILNVTPFIGGNSLVEMIVAPETSSIDPNTSQVIATTGTTAGTITAPTLDIRSADTVVVTPDAQPVVIGGLIGNNKSSTVTKVPLLGDIPLLGNLFKSTIKADNKTELLIFLTPHIVISPAQLVPMAATETGQANSITNSVSEQELDQFLERVPVKNP